MSRTLIIADLHLGSIARTSVLEREMPLQRLLNELERTDRLVLLGDSVELMEGRARAALSKAQPILRAFGAALGAGAQVVLVPGNHERPMIRSWLRRQGPGLPVDARVPADASPELRAVVEQLSPAHVEVRYPGVYLSDAVWATHGHYLDGHLIPVSNWGRLRAAGEAPASVTPWHYERPRRMPVSPVMRWLPEPPRRVNLSPAVRWLPEPVAARLRELRALIRSSTMPAIGDNVFDPRIAPLTARLLSRQMRHHALPALARVVHQLDVQAEWVVFGHVHRLGPLPGDRPEEWRDAEGRIGFLNTGSWLYEPRLVNRVTPPHPYWPGGAVLLQDGLSPRAVGLLDDVPGDQLQDPAAL